MDWMQALFLLKFTKVECDMIYKKYFFNVEKYIYSIHIFFLHWYTFPRNDLCKYICRLKNMEEFIKVQIIYYINTHFNIGKKNILS
ncbi:hypothetical protein PFAG_00979 [Plasmodium falciparum Santa Lucia]|uniref:Uncharacterized protein n=4 Tax=Plasmodium falciparum TaxID=5833 RepID=A0A024WCP7_PLAFA|nr:hypothetical protein PFTANZ_01126 [Plasmodium falciparum Tanzania (2000708)]ETW63057.1 hypothetical protein PFMC_01039 [Plasmodium falciparum CAMP/Malaysia]EUT90622.1 hypothetical protein PFAG_00979 [Plasmodium falciparum Santa Lucia]EWC78172.1 hypothetical protein C923_01108 [Plasmodium falciparum UGT5.1]